MYFIVNGFLYIYFSQKEMEYFHRRPILNWYDINLIIGYLPCQQFHDIFHISPDIILRLSYRTEDVSYLSHSISWKYDKIYVLVKTFQTHG